MITSATVFFVSEGEYPSLQKLCPDDYPFDYKEWFKRTNEGCAELLRPGAPPVQPMLIYARVADFAKWCNEAKIQPNSSARMKYAALLYSLTFNPAAHW